MQYALRYQNLMFNGLPGLIIEIHGHVSGQYPIEIASGFDLDARLPGDALFLARLEKLKAILPTLISSKLGKSYGVGVFPIDRDVKKTATNTYTFQKIRRARNRVGMEWYGLHIELAAELRTSLEAKQPGYLDALVNAFAIGISDVFLPLPSQGNFIPTHFDINDEVPISAQLFRVAMAAEGNVNRPIVQLNELDMQNANLLDGDEITLVNHGEQMRVPVFGSTALRAGSLAMSERMRRQLDLKTGGVVHVVQKKENTPSVQQNRMFSFVICEIIKDRNFLVKIGAEDVKHMAIDRDQKAMVRGHVPGETGTLSKFQINAAQMARTVSISSSLADRLTLTIGDILMIEAGE
jgi:hypothetical protein